MLVQIVCPVKLARKFLGKNYYMPHKFAHGEPRLRNYMRRELSNL